LLLASVQQVGAYSQLAHGRAVKIQPTSVHNLACTVFHCKQRTQHLYLKHAAQPQSEILLWISVLTLQMALALELLQHLRLLFMMMLNLYMVNTRSQPTVVCDHFVCKLTTHIYSTASCELTSWTFLKLSQKVTLAYPNRKNDRVKTGGAGEGEGETETHHPQ
jgi:hypothetical protein